MATCEDCSKGAPLPRDPEGEIDTTTGAYFAKCATSTEATSAVPRRAIMLLTDGFGLPLKNCKVIADTISRRLQCDVWVPDIFAGSPLLGVNELVEYLPDHAGAKVSWVAWFWMGLNILTSIPKFIRHRPGVIDARLDLFIKRLRDENAYEKIGAVGYCFGGATAIRLGSRGLVSSIVICHPAPFTNGQLNAITIPSSWVCAEDDIWFGRKTRLNAEAAFAARSGKDNFVDYEFRDYKGTAHGFASRPTLSIPEVKEAFEKALDQTVEWFEKTTSV